jgi:hypothetical protein
VSLVEPVLGILEQLDQRIAQVESKGRVKLFVSGAS